MAHSNTLAGPDTVVVLNQPPGIALIPKPTPLTRLNYYDGKFLRAADMQAEQDYGRRLQQLSNQAGGAGVVHGLALTALAGDELQLGAGLAVDNEGRVLHMPMEASVGIEDLINRSRQTGLVQTLSASSGSAFFALCETATATTTTAPPVAGMSLYVVGIGSAEALCGQEDVFGKLCEEACVSGTERPWRLEGVVLRALPLVLATPLPTSTAVTMATLHLRSRVASAYFADEARQIEHLISAAGLQSGVWCAGAPASAGGFVPLGVLGRAGGHTVLLDLWTARRERIETHPRRYWQWRMMMRPWDVYFAHILQFQCQLRDAWSDTPPVGDDPCDQLKRTVVEVSDLIAKLEQQYRHTSEQLVKGLAGPAAAAPGAAGATPVSLTLIDSMARSLQKVKGSFTVLPVDRVLIRRGIVELPSAGYLPVAPGSAITVNEQVRRLMGDGVDLRFCVVRPDFVAHALEEAQHMERISLLRGLDNPQSKEEVDILVADGEIRDAAHQAGVGWEVRVLSSPRGGDNKLANLDRRGEATLPYVRDVMTGAARSKAGADGRLALYFAGLVETTSQDAALAQLKQWAATRDNSFEQTLWESARLMTSAPPAAVDKKGGRRPPAAPDPLAIANRYAALRKQALDHRLKTLEHVARRATSAGMRHFAGLKDGADNDHMALWLELGAGTDPLAVAEGGSVDMNMAFSFLMPKAAASLFVDIDIVGARFTVESRMTSGQRVAVQGSLRGSAIVRGSVGTLAGAQRGISFNVPAILTAEPSSQGTTVVTEVDFAGTLFDGTGLVGLERLGVRVVTRPDGQSVSAEIEMGAQDSSLRFGARLDHDNAVLTLGHPLRTASETALEVLSTRESTPNFASEAAADLFGLRPSADDALTILAKRDWVLFHRRRDKQCGRGTTVQPLEKRRYQLHHLRAGTPERLRTARAAVLSANAANIAKVGFAPIGAATFDGGRSTLATPTAALLADWDAAMPGDRLGFGAIGSQGAAQAEGDALAKARLATLELTLMRGQLTGAIENQVLPVLPDLNLAGWDGAVFLISLLQQTVCHEVYRVDGTDAFGRLLGEVEQIGLVAALKQLELSPLAHVDFEGDAKTLAPASVGVLRTAWGTAGKPMDQAVGFYIGDNTESAAVKLQSQAIMGTLDGNVSDVFTRPAADLKEATDCRGITVLVAPVAPPVTTSIVLLTFALYDGRLLIGPNTLFKKVMLVDGTPSDPSTLRADVEAMLAFKPQGMTAAVAAAADMATADNARKLIEKVLTDIGSTPVKQTRTAVLLAREIKDLEAQGFPPEAYSAIVYFTSNALQ